MAIVHIGATDFYSPDGNGFTSTGIDTSTADFVVGALVCAAGNSPTVSDNKGNTVNLLTEYTQFFGIRAIRLFYAWNATVGSGHTFTVGGDTGLSPAIALGWYSGVQTTSDPLDTGKESGAGSDSSATIQPGSLTPANNGSLCISGLYRDTSFAGGAPTINGGFTRRAYTTNGDFGHFYVALADLIQTTAAAANPTWTMASADIVIANMAVFKAAAGGGGSVPLPDPAMQFNRRHVGRYVRS